ncbi:MAG: DUF2179 domain-containing protein [Tenuifilaceae bacterium]|jgi:uncharacterized protein YebE (UPF0316 family)|uniref:DUF2179 domain-containing protein n=1 Tax=Perlabentimonas gracilis TaxID=2715279 RepID=UPI00140B9DFC|nr:DUF2179 domain-containing protein [Perlabentimonas gracilis]MDX9769026.1 DUF2179 domain-containing protein [Tenuifilaceae bacterium]NHB69670.1 DUF2179 domain-containing protein [Perlabentimonas gracilis]
MLTIFDAAFFDSNIYLYLVLPLLIFFARIIDVTLGTMRIIFVSKGERLLAPILGFFEVFIWIIAIGKIMGNLDNYACYFGYAAGFATGNWVGMKLEEHLAMGNILVRVIATKDGSLLVKNLSKSGYGATLVEGEGSAGKVQLVYSIVSRENLKEVISVIEEFNPKAFFTIEDVRKVSSGIFPAKSPIHKLNPFRRWRKGK